MSNIHGLHSNRARDNEEDEDEDNKRYVGGVTARGGGSGLAVQPNPDHEGSSSTGRDASSSIFNLAAAAGGEGSSTGEPAQRTITMYRDGFVVDDGPYRRLNDPANAEFLRSLASGKTPRELSDGNVPGDIAVSLVDKRGEEYVETFRSFSGAGSSLGSATVTDGESSPASNTGRITPADYAAPSESRKGSDGKVAGIQVRLLSGRRIVARLPIDSPVHALVDEIQSSGAAGEDPYVLMSGFPPALITDLNQTIKEAGLSGATVTQKKQ